jgi:rRNA processing protein Krr1/Pno1
MCRINEVVQLYNLSFNNYVELRILEDELMRGVNIANVSNFMRLNDHFDRTH